MAGHTASVYSLVFSAESSVLVSGGADWTVRCWDVKGTGGPPETPRTNGIGGSAGSHHLKEPGPDVIETWVVHKIFLYFYLMKSQDGPSRDVPHQENPYYDRPLHTSKFMPRGGALPLRDTTLTKGGV